MCELDHDENWAPKNWCFWTVLLEKTLESPLDCKEIKPANAKGNQSWIFIGRTDSEAEAPVLWPLDAKSWLIEKDPYARKDWRQEKGTTEDEMVGWHHRLNEHKFEQTPGDGEGQRSPACSPWNHRVEQTERLNNYKSTQIRWRSQQRFLVGVELETWRKCCVRVACGSSQLQYFRQVNTLILQFLLCMNPVILIVRWSTIIVLLDSKVEQAKWKVSQSMFLKLSITIVYRIQYFIL